jgi:GntR family transcriptional repressor for pyruvate dehydrogenase complex
MAQRPITAAHDAAERLRRQILQGELKPGASLPGERELSERLGVSRLTLRAALTELQAQGLIEKVHGAGNRVLDYRETGGIELIAYLARQAIDGGVVPLPLLGELLELRRMVAIELLGLVCQRATSEELRALREHRASMQELVDDGHAFMEADLQFARLLVRAGHNLMLELLSNTVRRMVSEHPGFEAAFTVNARATLMVYDRLLELLESRDPTKVRELASRFFEPLDRRTLDRLAEASAIAASARPDSERAERTSPDVKASAGNDGATKRARKASEPTASRETTSRAAAREPKTKKKSRVRE